MPASAMNDLLVSLVQISRENEWLEWKVDDAEPEEIGEYVSALSNAALLHGQNRAYGRHPRLSRLKHDGKPVPQRFSHIPATLARPTDEDCIAHAPPRDITLLSRCSIKLLAFGV